METLVVNFFGGPCSGKSTAAAGVFYELKRAGVECENVFEFAKDCVWNEDFQAIGNQLYMFGCQYRNISRLLGKVEVVLTDSPLLLSICYKKFQSDFFDKLVVEQFGRMNNMNFVLDRPDEFIQNGRVETEDQSRQIDYIIDQHILHKYGIQHTHIGMDGRLERILSCIKDSKGWTW